MDVQKGNALFNQADGLFQQGRFQEALVVLDQLNAAYPRTRNVMFPRALCLEKLGRLAEADTVCDEMIQRFQEPRAQALKEQIRAGRATLDPFAGLTANGLDDLFGKPQKKTAPPRSVQSSFDAKRYLIIGAIVIAAVGAAYLGYKGLTGGETLEQVQAKIMDVWAKADAYSATVILSGKMKQKGMDMGLSGGASLDYLKKDAKAMFRLEGSVSVTGLPVPMETTLLLVGDGATAYVQFNMMGNQTVMKAPMPPSTELTPDVAKMFFEKLKTEMDMRLLREEPLDGQPAYVFDMTPKPGSEMASSLAKTGQDLGKLKVYFTKDFKSQVRCAVLDKSGAPAFTLSLKDINFQPSLSADRFTFKPPAGVEVIDMSNPSTAMQKLGAGGGKPF